ncbi:MAG: HdeD family acid-resistance protein [Acidiferrobacterales bacterium]
MAESETSVASASVERFGDLQKSWGWLMALGILFIVLGTIGLGMTVVLTAASVWLFGVLMLVGGGFQFVDAFKCKGWKSVVWHVLIAILYVITGIVVMSQPLMAASILTLMLAGAITAVGIMRVIMAFQHRHSKGWVWPLVGGIVSIILGVMIFSQWPVSGLWVIGLFVAIEMIVNGWSYIFIALAAKNACKAESATTAGIGAASA